MDDRSNKIMATWSISLDTDCPACGEDFDLLDTPDFWHDHPGLQPIENNSYKSRDVEVACPNCAHEFIVDLEY